MLFHKDGTLPPSTLDVWVFGSNELGVHGAGAAKVANNLYLRPYGTPIGFYENESMLTASYAIPTKDHNFDVLPLEEIKEYVYEFKRFVIRHPTKMFFVTRIGCGLAGFKDADIAPMFRGISNNCNMPLEWKDYL